MKKTFGLWVYKPEGKENIRCLCPKCLNDYIHNPDYIVRRLDPFAKRKDRCDKCDGDGWDYVVTDRYSSKKEKRGSNDRMELVAEPVEKVNVTLDGIILREEGRNISPTIYINDMYKKYQDCGDLEVSHH